MCCKRLVGVRNKFIDGSNGFEFECDVRKLVRYSVRMPLVEPFGIEYCGRVGGEPVIGNCCDADVIEGIAMLVVDIEAIDVLDGAAINFGGGGIRD